MRAFTAEDANKIYDVLVELCSANEHLREQCFRHLTTPHHSHEFRFQGALGFGGKVYCNAGRLYVGCYPEDKTPERRTMIGAANERLVGFAPPLTVEA